MFGGFGLKIKVRNELLFMFKQMGRSANPSSLDPTCKSLYYDLLNEMLPVMKSSGYKDSKVLVGMLATVAFHRGNVDANEEGFLFDLLTRCGGPPEDFSYD